MKAKEAKELAIKRRAEIEAKILKDKARAIILHAPTRYQSIMKEIERDANEGRRSCFSYFPPSNESVRYEAEIANEVRRMLKADGYKVKVRVASKNLLASFAGMPDHTAYYYISW